MLIVFEGIDGSGKGTQSKLLSSYLSSKNTSNTLFSFPCYDQTDFGKLIAKYLNGGYGSLATVPEAFASTLYALDRFEMKAYLDDALHNQSTVICDRYTPSNFAHQAAKLKTEHEQDDFISWVEELEYTKLKLPKPDKIIFLDIAPEITAELILRKAKRSYTDDKKDLHEKDLTYMHSVYQMYKKIAVKNGWIVINCLDNAAQLRNEQLIADEISSKLNL